MRPFRGGMAECGRCRAYSVSAVTYTGAATGFLWQTVECETPRCKAQGDWRLPHQWQGVINEGYNLMYKQEAR